MIELGSLQISAAGTCLANFLIGLGFLFQVALRVKSSFYKFVTFEVPKTLSFLNCHEQNLNQNKDLTTILVFSGIQVFNGLILA